MRYMIIGTCETIMNNHTCEIIDIILYGGKTINNFILI